MGSSNSKPQGVEVKIVKSKFCDLCIKHIHGTDGVAVGAMFHCCSKCNSEDLKNIIVAATKAFGVWKEAGGEMPTVEFLTEKPSGSSIQLPDGSWMIQPRPQINTVISMLQSGDVARDVTLICTMLSLCAKAFDACDTEQESFMIQNKILLGFLISIIAQSDYDAQTGQ